MKRIVVIAVLPRQFSPSGPVLARAQASVAARLDPSTWACETNPITYHRVAERRQRRVSGWWRIRHLNINPTNP